jgi:tetratricopeptide (TPR) repeat protein
MHCWPRPARWDRRGALRSGSCPPSRSSTSSNGLPTDIPGLYQATFARAGKIFGQRLTLAFLGSIAVSRSGWREVDFRTLIPQLSGDLWDELQFASLRRHFRAQLRQRGALGQWDFSHWQMRVAVDRMLRGRNIVQGFHAIGAQHLLSLTADDPLRQSETMVHLLGSEDWAGAAAFYGAASLTVEELDGATRTLADAVLTASKGVETTKVPCPLDATRDLQAKETAAAVAHRLMFDPDAMIDQRVKLEVRAALANSVRQEFERLVRKYPGNATWQRDLSVSHNKLGRVQSNQGNPSAALTAYQTSLAIRDRLAKSDPGDAGWQQDLSVSHDNIGDVLRAQGNLPGSLESYRASLALAERLTRADPGNARWLRELSVSYNNIGNVQRHQGNLSGSLDTYSASHAIRERLAKADPGDAGWQRDLCISHSTIGDVQRDQGNLPAALAGYQASLVIADRLAKSDPSNARWQWDITFANEKISEALIDLGNTSRRSRRLRGLRFDQRTATSSPSWFGSLT